MIDTKERAASGVQWLSDEEARVVFDEQARKTMGMSGEEFLQRWDAGEFDVIADDRDHPEIMRLVMLINFAR